MLAVMWIRSSMIYRASFVTMALGQFFVTLLDFVAIVIMFGNIDRLGGFGLPEVAFLYGMSGFAFGLADLLVGNDGPARAPDPRRVPGHAADPAGAAFVQVACRRLRAAPPRPDHPGPDGARLCAMAGSTSTGPGTGSLLMPVMLVSGTVIFCCDLRRSARPSSSSRRTPPRWRTPSPTAATRSRSTRRRSSPRICVGASTFVVPLAFVNWLPAPVRAGPAGPARPAEGLQFASPLVARAARLVAGLAWRAGLRSYRSTGS